MPSTPLLGITQVSTSQNSKEVTINDAIIALEDATNRNKPISYAAVTTYTLTATEATRNFIFRAQAATAASILNFPIAVNGAPYNRVFAVRNESGQSLTVKFATGAGTAVIIPNNQTRLIAALDGLNMIVAAEPQSAVSFVSLADTPDTLVGAVGKFLSVNAEGTELVFVDAAVFPAYALNAGKALVVNATADGVEWVTINSISTFLELTDTPNSFATAGGKLVAVKSDETGIEFIDLPPVEAVEFATSTKWRIRVIIPGTEAQVGFGEIEFQDNNGIDQTGTGVASASNFDAGKEPAQAFDGDLSSGAGWLTEETFLGEAIIDYTLPVTKIIRTVKLWPITGFPTEFTPQRFYIEYFDGTDWIEAAERIAAPWVEGTPQTFAVNGFTLQSVTDAPVDGALYARRNAAWESINEQIRDIIGAALSPGTGINITVNDAGDQIVVSATGLDGESVRDVIGAAMQQGVGLTFAYNDAGDTLTFSLNIATVTDIRTGTSDIKGITPFGLYAAAAPVALVDGATITIDGNTGMNFSVTLAGNRTLENPTNMKPGQSGIIIITQDVTGSRTLTYGTNWKFSNGAAANGVLSTPANTVDVLSYFVRTNGTIMANLGKAFAS